MMPSSTTMDAQSRQQRRRFQRSLRKYHRLLLSKGLPPTGTLELAQSLALLFRDCIESGEGARGVIDAARLAHRLYDLSEKRHPPREPLSCKAGCDYCCYTFVGVSAPEAFLIADEISTGQSRNISRELFTDRARPLAGLSPGKRAASSRLPCPFLEDRKCSAYSFRPLVCRKMSSYSVQDCIDGFDNPAITIRTDADRQTFGEGCSVTLAAALRSLSLPWNYYEMSEAVSTILHTDNALERWVSGEDILRDVQAGTHISADMEKALCKMVDAIS